jgi:signal transduction histidine kinase
VQEQLNLLNRISDELNTDLDPGRMLQRVLDLTVEHLSASTGSILLLNQQNRVTDFILQQKVPRDQADRIVGTVLTEGFAGWVLNSGHGDIIADTRHDQRWVVYDNQPYDVRSVLGVPLRRRQRIIGILTLVHAEPHKFNPTALPLLNAIADQAAIALENAQLFRQTEQERQKLEAIIHSTQDAVLVTSPARTVLLLNLAAQEMMELNDQPWEDQPLQILTTNPELLNLFAPDAPTTGEVPLPDGRTMWAKITEIPGIGRVAVFRDISNFKALDKMKRDFVTAFTHDLRTPLATVKGYVELVRMDGPVTDRQEEDLVGVTKAANLMKSLIEDLLQLSRLEQLEELVRIPLDLEGILETSLTQIKPSAEAKGVKLAVEYRRGGLMVEGNAVLLVRAVGNLLDNALKYTPVGGQIRVTLDRSDGQALVAVIDNGPGIRAKDLPRIFEKFFRARPELDEIPGSGLGLAIVKTIVEQHGGRVWVESEPSVGSTFTLALPLLAEV